jgi:hypothetical protein
LFLSGCGAVDFFEIATLRVPNLEYLIVADLQMDGVNVTAPLRPAVDDIVYLAQGVDLLPSGDAFKIFTVDELEYQPFAKDFGPLNLSCVVRFVELLKHEIETNPDTVIIYNIEYGKTALTNAVFLLGCYNVIALARPCELVEGFFDWADDFVEPYSDVSGAVSDFKLSLADCWRGVEKAIAHEWLKLSTDGEYWGMINIDEYRHYDNPCNGDMHMVVPGQFLAFAGPIDLEDGVGYEDDARGFRRFSPIFYADLFEECKVLKNV